jgi:hypothetical protein
MKTSLSFLFAVTLGLGMASLAPMASAETAPSKASKAASAKGKAAPAKEESATPQPEVAPEAKPEAKADAEPAQPSPQSPPVEGMERKISPFGPHPLPPPSADEGFPEPVYGYPQPAYPPPGYPPPMFPPPGYPPHGFCHGYPPPGFPHPGFGPPPCRHCAHQDCGQLPQPDMRPGFHTHDGFFLRLGLGVGYARTSISVDGDKLTYVGASIPFNLAIGAAIRPNLILFGEVISHGMSSPDKKYAGETKNANSTNLSIQGIGPGVAYYFMPINIYVSGSILLHKVNYDDDNDNYDATDLSTFGFAGNLMVGKEWWVSRDWGLGLAIQGMLGTAKNRAQNDQSGHLIEGRWNSMAFGLLMSATYN